MMQDLAMGPAVDLTVLHDLLRELGGDAAMRLDLIDSYRAESADQLRAIEGAMEAGDARAVAGVAHSLRSASALLGALTLAGLLLQLEQVARTAPADLGGLRPALVTEHGRVSEAFGRLRLTD